MGFTFTMEDVSTTTKLVELEEGDVGLKVARERLNCNQWLLQPSMLEGWEEEIKGIKSRSWWVIIKWIFLAFQKIKIELITGSLCHSL